MKKERQKLVPKLRFSEFTGEWMEKTLGEVCSSLEYGMNAPAKPYDGENKYIRITDIDENSNKYMNLIPVSPDGRLEEKYILQENDILFARTGASTGKTYLYNCNDGKLYYAGFLIRGRIKEEYNGYFIFAQTLLDTYKKWVTVESARSGQPGINADQYSRYKMAIVDNIEQQKIAQCLTSLDEKITAQSQKIEQLKAHKKGLMQKLFPQEGAKVPRLRFAEFAGDGEWSIVKIADIGEVVTGNTPKTQDTDNYGGEFLFVSPIDIIGQRYVLDTQTKLTEKGFKSGRVIKEYSTLFVCIGSTIGKVAQNKYMCITNQQINSVTADMHFDKDFIYAYLFFHASKISRLAATQAVPIINKTLFSTYANQMPINIKEQQKIANCLTSLDDLITAHTQKLELLKKHKKGLMQGLFPQYRV